MAEAGGGQLSSGLQPVPLDREAWGGWHSPLCLQSPSSGHCPLLPPKSACRTQAIPIPLLLPVSISQPCLGDFSVSFLCPLFPFSMGLSPRWHLEVLAWTGSLGYL